MILLDSLYINVSGGKVLLDYLVEKIEEVQINCFYLFDDRCKNDYEYIPKDRKLFLKASLLNRHRFYKENKNRFSKVLCLGNLPPTVRLNAKVFTYFHQLLYLKLPKHTSFFGIVRVSLKRSVINYLKSNTDYWYVQTFLVQNKLADKFKVDIKDIMLMPFYPPFINDAINYDRKDDGFVYISNGSKYKNHLKLIEAFCNYFDEYNKGVLHLTISDKFSELVQVIKEKVNSGYPIINHGFVDRMELVEIYQSNRYLIFPSLTESFGLGLIEAIENGCDVIGADLPYTYAVCNPSIVFNPLDVNDIKRAMVESQSDNVDKTKQLVFNQIDELIFNLIHNEYNK